MFLEIGLLIVIYSSQVTSLEAIHAPQSSICSTKFGRCLIEHSPQITHGQYTKCWYAATKCEKN